jgi:hypothetical protein
VANGYVSSVAWAAIAQFAASTAYTVGQYIRQLATPTYGNERVFKCTVAGTTAGSEPTWNLGGGATTTSGTATFTQVGGREAEQQAGNWRAALGTVQAALNVFGDIGPTIFVSSDHTETSSAANLSIASSSRGYFNSVSRLGATLPPTDTDLVPGATLNTSTTNSIILGGRLTFTGLTFKAGSGSSNASIQLAGTYGGASEVSVILQDCSLVLNNTNASSTISTAIPTFASSAETIMRNTTMTFGATGQQFNPGTQACVTQWFDTPSAIQGATIPTNFLGGFYGGTVLFRGVDLSALNTALYTANPSPRARLELIDCQLNASLSIPTANGSPVSSDFYIRVWNSDSSTTGKNYNFTFINYGVNITPSTEISRTSGASDGVTSYSHRYNANGNVTSIIDPAIGGWMHEYWGTTGSTVTLTINAIVFTTAQPTNALVWMETEALETAGVPLATGHTTGVKLTTTTGTNLATTTEAWDAGSVAARQNSHAYVVGDLIKLASNPGRVFRCTSAGTSAGSEPGGYASAVDGGAVTDSGAVFRAGWRCKLTQAFTPQVKGVVRARVQSAQPGGTIFYVDPKMDIA